MHILKYMKRLNRLYLFFCIIFLTACSVSKKTPAVIENKALRMIYQYGDLPFQYAYTGVKCKDIEMRCDDPSIDIINEDNCAFRLKSMGTTDSIISIYIYTKNTRHDTLLEKLNMRVVKNAVPKASLRGNTGDYISIGTLRAVRKVWAHGRSYQMGDFYNVTSFDYLVIKKESNRILARGQSSGEKIPYSLLVIFKTLMKGDFIYISNIQTVNTFGVEMAAENNMTFWVR